MNHASDYGYSIAGQLPSSEPDDYDDSYPPRCTNPGGHEWVINEESDRCYCQWCGADGDA